MTFLNNTNTTKNKTVILGIDPGTIVSGYGVLECNHNNYRALDYGAIRPPKGDKLSGRYLIIFNSVETLMKKYSPDMVVVETQYVKNNVQSAIKLGMARGAVIVAAAKNGVPIYEYTPSVAKRAVVGTGQASKHQVQIMVQKLLNLSSPPEPEDAADALALAICLAQSLHQPYKTLQEV